MCWCVMHHLTNILAVLRVVGPVASQVSISDCVASASGVLRV